MQFPSGAIIAQHILQTLQYVHLLVTNSLSSLSTHCYLHKHLPSFKLENMAKSLWLSTFSYLHWACRSRRDSKPSERIALTLFVCFAFFVLFCFSVVHSFESVPRRALEILHSPFTGFLQSAGGMCLVLWGGYKTQLFSHITSTNVRDSLNAVGKGPSPFHQFILVIFLSDSLLSVKTVSICTSMQFLKCK